MLKPKDIKTIEELRSFSLQLSRDEVAAIAELLLAIAFELGIHRGIELASKACGIKELPNFEAQA